MTHVLLALLLLAGGGAPDDACRAGVYYYPWYGGDFHGGRYLRAELDPRQEPELGEYDDREAAVIEAHAKWSRRAGIDCWIASWWGPGSREDSTLRGHVLPSPHLDGIELAIHYETAGRTREFSTYGRLESDFAYLARTYFANERYLRIDSRPVVVVYLTRVLEARGVLAESVRSMRAGARAEGIEVYLVGDHAFGEAGPRDGLGVLDAVTNYDVYGALGAKGHAGAEAVAHYAASQARWRERAHAQGVAFLPSATPGFNDTSVRAGHAPLSRALGPEEELGSLFRALLRAARPLADESTGRLVLVTSWNEWHEDTQIEPVRSAPPTSAVVEAARGRTAGLSYEGYGTRYLEILREELSR